MRIYLAHPLRLVDDDTMWWIRLVTEKLELEGHQVYAPWRDTNQKMREIDIHRANLDGMASCDCVALVWDGISQGVLFDMGMAFALGLPLVIIRIPPPTNSKSFQNLFIQWQAESEVPWTIPTMSIN